LDLLVGAAILREIAEFAERFDGLPISPGELKITLRFPSFDLVFIQPERYDQRIISHIEFEPGVGFFMEDIVAACCGLDETIHVATPNVSAPSEILSVNEQYVREILEFISKNIVSFTALPPPWFEAAMKISDKKTRKHLPELADEDLSRKWRLLKSWRR
jgi:hypothetical protein